MRCHGLDVVAVPEPQRPRIRRFLHRVDVVDNVLRPFLAPVPSVRRRLQRHSPRQERQLRKGARTMMKRCAGLLFLTMGSVPALAQTTFHGDAARTGVYGTPGPRQLGGAKWIFKTGGPIVSSPAVAGGVVYI